MCADSSLAAAATAAPEASKLFKASILSFFFFFLFHVESQTFFLLLLCCNFSLKSSVGGGILRFPIVSNLAPAAKRDSNRRRTAAAEFSLLSLDIGDSSREGSLGVEEELGDTFQSLLIKPSSILCAKQNPSLTKRDGLTKSVFHTLHNQLVLVTRMSFDDMLALQLGIFSQLVALKRRV